MNGRTLSRAIQSSRPTATAATIRTATRGENGANRGGDPSAGFTTNGGGGSEVTQAADPGPSAAPDPGRAGSFIVPQTSRRGP